MFPPGLFVPSGNLGDWLLRGLAVDPSSRAVRLWLEFSATPTGRNWYRAHNASIVSGYIEHWNLAEIENAPERFFMNVALARVLYAHVLVGAPSMALGSLAPLGRVLGNPRLGMAGVFLSLRRAVPNRYPLAFEVERQEAPELLDVLFELGIDRAGARGGLGLHGSSQPKLTVFINFWWF